MPDIHRVVLEARRQQNEAIAALIVAGWRWLTSRRPRSLSGHCHRRPQFLHKR